MTAFKKSGDSQLRLEVRIEDLKPISSDGSYFCKSVHMFEIEDGKPTEAMVIYQKTDHSTALETLIRNGFEALMKKKK